MYSTLADQAYRHIFDQLLRRELRPGDLLDRKRVAAETGNQFDPSLGRRAAFNLEGFLTTRRRQGTFVRPPSIEDVRVLLLREALECQSARLYRGERIRKALPRLRPLARAADKAASAGRELWMEDFAFHQALVCFDGMRGVDHMLRAVVNLTLFYATALISPMQPVTYDRHLKLLEELEDSSVDKAESRIRFHLRSGKEALFEVSSVSN